MKPSEYRERSLARSPMTDKIPNEFEAAWLLYASGMSAEAGEVLDEIKKHVFHDKPYDAAKLLKEIGDVLWYVDRALVMLGLTFEQALEANDFKLAERYPGGWAAATKRYDHTDG